MASGSEGAGGGGEQPVSLGGVDGRTEGIGAPHPLGDPLRWPASALFRWAERVGPRDVWDALPFPPGGPGVLARLRAAAASSKLFGHGRVEGRAPAPAISLSAELGAGGVSFLLPINDDEDVKNAVHLWSSSNQAGFIGIVVREEGGAAAVPRSVGGWAAAELSPLQPSPLSPHHGGGESRPPRPVPALGNALPLEMWACVLNAVASSRSVAFWNLCFAVLAPSHPRNPEFSSLRLHAHSVGCLRLYLAAAFRG